MDKIETEIEGLFEILLKPSYDERGYFCRNHDAKIFSALGLVSEFSQSSLSYNKMSGTLRGMHMQQDPHAETKLVQCVSGAVFDVVVDLRPSSITYKKWKSFELSIDSNNAIYIPPGLAHGFLSLTDNAVIQYRMNCDFVSEAQLGLRWDDPQINIEWPHEPIIISERDKSFKFLSDYK